MVNLPRLLTISGKIKEGKQGNSKYEIIKPQKPLKAQKKPVKNESFNSVSSVIQWLKSGLCSYIGNYKNLPQRRRGAKEIIKTLRNSGRHEKIFLYSCIPDFLRKLGFCYI